jgi:creatinine amidohydrolase
MTRRPYILAEATWKGVQEQTLDGAILPWGATEAHNTHLPYATDIFQVQAVAERWAADAWNEGLRLMVLPTVPFGVNTAQIDLPFHINMNPSTQFLVVKDVVTSLERQGIRTLYLLNGHGANAFTHMARELYAQSKVMIICIDWFRVVSAAEFFDQPGDHADELETSVMMAVRGDLVDDPAGAGRGAYTGPPLKALNRGVAWSQRGWLGRSTLDTGMGDPRPASAEKGERYLAAVNAKLLELAREVRALDRDRF